MSNRTAEASKAIREAWEREKKLVQIGEGTRDWTPEQQKDILDRGKAYDENGKAFEGHHMKSAEEYPQYQGDPDNIQFLTRTEHKDAHGGDFHKSTNGYYNYITKNTEKFFDEKELIPCETIILSNPVQHNNSSIPQNNDLYHFETPRPFGPLVNNNNIKQENRKQYNYTQQSNKAEKKGIIDKLISFPEAHPKITKILSTGAKILLSGYAEYKAQNYCTNKATNKTCNKTLERNISQSNNENSGKEYPENRSSPRRHEVSEYDKKNGTHVNGYTRGGKKMGRN